MNSAKRESAKIAFIGTHGVGKTTLCYGLAAKLKSKDVVLEVVHEVARRCPLPINEATSVAAQSWILHTQIAEELVAAARHPVVVCDRSALDNYVYLLLSQGAQPDLDRLVDSWMQTYELLIFVPVVGAPSADGVRALDPAFQLAVQERLRAELRSRNLRAIELAVERRECWLDDCADLVWQRIQPPQLSLL